MVRNHPVRARDLLAVRFEQVDDSLTLRAIGELDLLSAPTLEESVRAALVSSAREITLDLTGVTFIDSAGLLVLLSAAEGSRDADHRLQIRCGPSAVRSVIEVCGADSRLPLVA